MAKGKLFEISNVAQSTPFESNRSPIWNGSAGPSGITSQNVQDAIEEVKSFAESVSRFVVSPGFDGTASSGRYLEFSSNVDSNLSGFVMPRAGLIKELSLAVVSNATTVIEVRKWNGSVETVLTSISLSAQRTNYITGLNITLAAGDELRARVLSGSSARPILFIFAVFT